jgi:hypothetical protein
MPVNFVQVKQNLQRYSEKVKAQQDLLDRLSEELWQAYSNTTLDLDVMREFVMQAAKQNSKVVCACPTYEPLLSHIPLPEKPADYTIMAADGSQIQPSRHKSVQFCVINVGVIKARIGSQQAPEIYTSSQLLAYDELFNAEGGLIDGDTVALRRDHAERAALAEHVTADHTPIITLTDGPLGIFRRKDADTAFESWQKKILDVYAELHEQGVITAGYIDKPGSDMIGRLFSLLRLPEEERRTFEPKKRHFKGISDAALLSRFLTTPGERSAIFQVVNGSDQKSNANLEVFFFYLNISQKTPYLVRVEFPHFVAESAEQINLLHAAIYNEVQVLETHPYPYILHRAHELAVIHFDEHAEVERLILEAYQQAGIKPGLQSNKEANKIISGIK